MNVAVIGLGFVGLTLSLSLADRGVKVYGVEINPETFNKIKNKIPTINEFGIKEILERTSGKTFFPIMNLEELPEHPDTFIICVETPIVNNIPNTSYITNAVKTVTKIMTGDELIILRSTCPVGITEQYVIPIIEDAFKKRNITKPLNIAFAPERTAEGVALQELTFLPQIVSGNNSNAIIRAMDLFRNLTPTIIQASSIKTAEMIKLIDNSFRDVRFAYANEISLMSDNLGVDVYECITKANAGYSRNNIPLPSPGVGGPCLSKDPYLLATKDQILNLPDKNSLILTGRKINESITKFLAKKIIKNLPIRQDSSKQPKVFIMGFGFKGEPETNDIRKSPTLDLIKNLNLGYKVYSHDPLISKEVLEEHDTMPVGIEDGFKNANCVIIMTNHKNYKKLDVLSLLKNSSKPCLFIDCWRLFDKKIFYNSKDVIYSGLGVV
jgi:nucleotide sugar dehydrogenase